MTSSTNPFGEKGWTPKRLGSLKGKTYVITGANSGAGFEAAKVLLSKNARVVMLCRNPEKANAAIEDIKRTLWADVDVSFIEMDLGVLGSVREAGELVKSQVPDIDALICNAGIANVAKQVITVDGFESQLGVNHYGHFLLCGLLFERIETSNGRIVVVGSNGYKMIKKIQFDDMNFDGKYSSMKAYCQSKLALMVFAYELQRRIKATGKNVPVQVCHPGASRTNLGGSPLVFKILMTILSPLIQSAERGSWPEVLCATEDGLKSEALYGPTKRRDTGGVIGECKLQLHALDREVADKLWTLSEEKTGLRWTLQ